MKSSLSNYKEYPFPWRYVIVCVIMSIVGIVLVDFYTVWAVKEIKGTLDVLLGIPITLIVFAVAMIILLLIMKLLCMGKKTFRGIGLYQMIKVIKILCAVALVVGIVLLILVFKKSSIFNYLGLILQCLVPFLFVESLRYNKWLCYCCGLLNTQVPINSTSESLGTHVKYHNEGGYYTDVETTGSISGNGFYKDVRLSSKHYVPKTTVRDGEFEKEVITTTYQCRVCGDISSSSYKRETKVGD